MWWYLLPGGCWWNPVNQVLIIPNPGDDTLNTRSVKASVRRKNILNSKPIFTLTKHGVLIPFCFARLLPVLPNTYINKLGFVETLTTRSGGVGMCVWFSAHPKISDAARSQDVFPCDMLALCYCLFTRTPTVRRYIRWLITCQFTPFPTNLRLGWFGASDRSEEHTSELQSR